MGNPDIRLVRLTETPLFTGRLSQLYMYTGLLYICIQNSDIDTEQIVYTKIKLCFISVIHAVLIKLLQSVDIE